MESLKEEMATKDGELKGLKVRLAALEQPMEILYNIHVASNDKNFLEMMNHVLEQNKKIEYLTNEKAYL